MRFVMTGHKGLIGSFLLEKLKEQGHEPLLLVDVRDGKNVVNIEEEVLNEKADLMIHLAASCKISKTIKDPSMAFNDNVLGTYKVLEFCRKNKIPKIIFTSSERIIEKEKNPYTASKIYGEELCKGYQQCYGIDYVIIRPSGVYGPFDDETSRVMDIFIRKAMKDGELEIYGDKTKTLDFTYIDDFVSGFLLAMEQKNGEYNFGTGKATSLGYLADLIIQRVGKGKKVFKEQEIAQPQHVEIDIIEMKKLGYDPKISIEEGVRRTVDWYLKNL